jgi:hypothetical protein
MAVMTSRRDPRKETKQRQAAAASGRLTNRQRVFIAEYLKCWNAAEAARRAGYSDESARYIGAENLTKPNIKTAIEERMQALAMEADEALYRLSDIARGTLADFMDPETGQLDLAQAREAGKLGLVKRFTRTTFEGGETVRVELYDAQDALKTILNERRLRAGDPTSRVDVQVRQLPPLPEDTVDDIFAS